MSKNIARIRVIQFSPDREVGEVLNVGLVGVCGEHIHVRWVRNTDRIKAIFGRAAANVVESMEQQVRAAVAGYGGTSDQRFDFRSLAADGGTSLLLGPEVVVTAEEFEEAMLRAESRFLRTATTIRLNIASFGKSRPFYRIVGSSAGHNAAWKHFREFVHSRARAPVDSDKAEREFLQPVELKKR